MLFQVLDRGAIGNLHLELVRPVTSTFSWTSSTLSTSWIPSCGRLIVTLAGYFAGAERGVVAVENLRLKHAVAVVDILVIGQHVVAMERDGPSRQILMTAFLVHHAQNIFRLYVQMLL